MKNIKMEKSAEKAGEFALQARRRSSECKEKYHHQFN